MHLSRDCLTNTSAEHVIGVFICGRCSTLVSGTIAGSTSKLQATDRVGNRPRNNFRSEMLFNSPPAVFRQSLPQLLLRIETINCLCERRRIVANHDIMSV